MGLDDQEDYNVVNVGEGVHQICLSHPVKFIVQSRRRIVRGLPFVIIPFAFEMEHLLLGLLLVLPEHKNKP